MGAESRSLRTDHPGGALGILFRSRSLRLLGLHDTGRSGVTTTCRRRMTVWGRPHDVSAHLLHLAIHKALTRWADSHVSLFLRQFQPKAHDVHMTRHDERAHGRRSDLSEICMQSSLGVWEPRHSCNMSHDDRFYFLMETS
jgi:hypothetical protein